jgi:8-oxo-dGTP pyrophosphatase MutT (NUDIX family)
MKKTSAGVVLSDGSYVLIGHASGKPERNGYDIFKGWVMFGVENPVKAALRELEEESGIVLLPDEIEELGKFKYQPKKDLKLYLYRSENLKREFKIEDLRCTSFIPFKGIPEINGYKFCPINKLSYFLYNSLHPIVNKIIKEKF